MRSLVSPTLLGPALLLSLAGVLSVNACSQVSKGNSDGDTSSSAAPNQKPIADAGDDVTQTADTPVTLSGAGSSDPDNNTPMKWHWSFDHVPEGSALMSAEAPFKNNNTAEGITSGFTADAVGTYVVKLVVTDSKGLDSDPDYVIVTIETPDGIPVANAGTDATATLGGTVSVNGSASYDPLGRPLTYAWTLLDKPTASTLTTLTDATSAIASFVPDAKGVYVASLVVNNGLAPSNADAVTITVTGDNGAPTANAGDDQSIEDCTTVTLDCSRSADPDGDHLTYRWELQSKPTTSLITSDSLADRNAAMTTFYPDQAGVYVWSCAVNDGTEWSTPDSVTLTADERSTNTRPVANAGADVSVSGGSATCAESGYTYDCDECADQTVTLGADAVASDPDGDPVTVMWTVVSGSATITDPTSLSTTITLKDAAPTEPSACEDTDYEVELTVTDCTGASSTDTVTFTVNCCGVADTSSLR